MDDLRFHLDHIGNCVHRYFHLDHVVDHVDHHADAHVVHGVHRILLDHSVDHVHLDHGVDHGVDVCLDHVGNAVDHTAVQVVVHDRLDHVDDDHLDHVADTRIDHIVDHVDHGGDYCILLDHVIDHVDHHDPVVDDVVNHRCRGNRSNRGRRFRNVDWYRNVYVVCRRNVCRHDVVCRNVVVRGT